MARRPSVVRCSSTSVRPAGRCRSGAPPPSDVVTDNRHECRLQRCRSAITSLSPARGGRLPAGYSAGSCTRRRGSRCGSGSWGPCGSAVASPPSPQAGTGSCSPCCCCAPVGWCPSRSWSTRSGRSAPRPPPAPSSRPACRDCGSGSAALGLPPEIIVTDPVGYGIRVEPADLDAEVFARGVEAARAAVAAGRPDRGPPALPVRPGPLAGPGAERDRRAAACAAGRRPSTSSASPRWRSASTSSCGCARRPT